MNVSEHVCGWCWCLIVLTFLLFSLVFRLSFLFFLFVDLLSDFEYICFIIYFSIILKLICNCENIINTYKNIIYTHCQEPMKSLRSMVASYYHYCAVGVLMFWEYYLQAHNGTHSCMFFTLVGHIICLVTLCFFEVFFFCNHIHMSFVIYNTKTYFFMRVLFRTLCSLCNKTNCFHGIKCGRKGIYLIDFQMCHEFFDCWIKYLAVRRHGMVYFNPMILFWNRLVIFRSSHLLYFVVVVIIPRPNFHSIF